MPRVPAQTKGTYLRYWTAFDWNGVRAFKSISIHDLLLSFYNCEIANAQQARMTIQTVPISGETPKHNTRHD
jgi:hypothetical protein